MLGKFYVYKITNLVNDKLYIGKSHFTTTASRWQRHLWTANGKSKNGVSLIHKAIRKYGKNNFTFEVIEITDKESVAFHLEKCWIGQLRDSKYALYNLTDGGDGLIGYKPTQQALEKMSNAQRGENNPRSKLSEIDVQKIQLLIMQDIDIVNIANNFNVSRKTINNIALGRTWKHVQINKFEPYKRGKKCSEQKRRTISLAITSLNLTGNNNPNAKLNLDLVTMLRTEYANGINVNKLSIKYRIPYTTIRDIVKHITWK